MASDSPNDTCPSCLQNFQDARVLPCLHSVCKACIDSMAVTAADGLVTCPICRATARLPPTGAAGLPKDVSASTRHTHDGSGSLECGMCIDDKTSKKPTMWCKQCRLPLCDHHVGPHIVNASSHGDVHLVVPLSMASQETLGEGKDSATPMCVHHGEALKYHCGTCDVAICGDCFITGDHKKHDNVRLIKDILNERKARVNAKVDTLENDVIDKLEHSLQAVDNVSTKLARQADEVRTDIRQAGKRAVEFVQGHVEQMVQEVDDLELHRCKLLDRQRDALQSHLDAAKNVICFRDRVMELTDSGEEAQFSLLDTLETRTAILISTPIEAQPCHHSRIMFSAASDVDLLRKTKESVGKVIPFKASAKHSGIEGSTVRKVRQGKTVNITVRTKDKHGDNLTSGGEVVEARCASNMAAADNLPTTTITDNSDGTYTILCTCSSTGTSQMKVYVNGAKIATDVTIRWEMYAFISSFDPTHCHQSITISDDRKTASIPKAKRPGGDGYCSVLGVTPMRCGQYSWKMRIGDKPNYMFYCLGISSKPLSPQREGDHGTVAYCWKSRWGDQHFRDGVQVVGKLSDWQGNDTLKLDLDCERHALWITNLRSGEHSIFSNLPDKEYFQFACLYRGSCENRLEFVQ